MKSGYTHVSILIDRSGSMSRLKSDVIGGFNQLVEDQQKEAGELTLSLVQFDDMNGLQFEVTNDFSPIKEVKLLDEMNYAPRGGTPLNDALVRLIELTGNKLASLSEDQRPEKVMFVVITDGEENSSKEFNTQHVKDKIDHQEQKYGWKFLYLGANQDSFTEAKTRGFSGAMNFDFNTTGSMAMYTATSNVLKKSRSADIQEFCVMDFSADLGQEYKTAKKDLEEKK